MQTLELPLTLHLVRNSDNGARAGLEQARSILKKVADIWRPAGIEIRLRACYEPQVELATIEAAYPNPQGKTDRQASCDPLKQATRLDETALNVFLVRRVRSFGSKDLINVYELFRKSRCLLVAEHYPPASTKLNVALAIGRYLGLKADKTAPSEQLMNFTTTGTALTTEQMELARAGLLKEFPPPAVLEPTGEFTRLPVRCYLLDSPGHATNRGAAHIRELVAQANELWLSSRFRIDLLEVAPVQCSDAAVQAATHGAANCNQLLSCCAQPGNAIQLFFAGNLPQPYASHVFPRAQVAVLDDREQAFGLGQTLTLLGLLYPLVDYETLGWHGIPGFPLQQLLKHADHLYGTRSPGDALPSRPAPREDHWDKVMADLDRLVGLQTVKERVRTLANYLKLEQRRRGKKRASEPITLHTLLTGNPGTGKTTLARLLGRLFKAGGFLPRGHVVEADRSLLVTDSAMRSAQKVKDAVRQARGGVLFIDEAQSLVLNSNDPYGTMAVQTLVQQMEEQRDQLAVVLAGLGQPMTAFLNQHRTLHSRLRHRFELPDYEPAELREIFMRMAHDRGFQLTRNAYARLGELTERLYRERDGRFGNARLIRNLLEAAIEKQATRGDISDSGLFQLQSRDIVPLPEIDRGPELSSVRITEPPGGDSLEQVFRDLDALIGLAPVKKQVRALADRFRVEQRRARKNPAVLHMLFMGPPGTGKTTVARLMGRILLQLELLSRGHVLETDRAGLVAVYMGQTAFKTNYVIDRALGGVLFVDEAYALCDGGHNYGQEALVTLLKRMEDQSDRLSVVLAGYPDEMEKLIESNPGLPSRFPHRIEFPNYGAEELSLIFQRMAADRELRLEPEALEAVDLWLKRAWSDRGEQFGNARVARNLLERVLENQAGRLARQELNDELDLLRRADVPDYTPPGGRPRLGFRLKG